MGLLSFIQRIFEPKVDTTASSTDKAFTIAVADLQGAGWDIGGGVDALEFCATLQMRTPLRVLSRHHERHTDKSSPPPQIAHEGWEGIWVPRSTFMGFLQDGATMASEIGPIPLDGGDFLQMLLVIRAIVEASEPLAERKKRLIEALKSPRWQETVAKVGGPEAVASRFFPSFLSTIPGLPAETVVALVDANLKIPAALESCDDACLLAFKGIGPKKLAAIRAACAAAHDPASEDVINPRMGIDY